MLGLRLYLRFGVCLGVGDSEYEGEMFGLEVRVWVSVWFVLVTWGE